MSMVKIRSLTPVLAKKAKDELNENSNNIENDIEYLKEWILKQPHLKARTTDQFLLAFLRGCKHSMEKTKEKIDKYYSLKDSIPEHYKDRDVDNPKVKEIIKLGAVLRLFQTTNDEDGPRITIFRLGAYNPEKYNFSDIMKINAMITDIGFIEDDNAIIAGQIDIIDLANVTLQHFFRFDTMFLKRTVIFTEKASPIRQKGIHFINTPPGFEKNFNSVQSVMSEKKKNRLFVHGNNMKTFYQHIPRKLLPVEYGGLNYITIPDIVCYWETKMLEYRNYFQEDSKFGSNEKLRIGEPINPESVFGISGSFKSLNID